MIFRVHHNLVPQPRSAHAVRFFSAHQRPKTTKFGMQNDQFWQKNTNFGPKSHFHCIFNRFAFSCLGQERGCTETRLGVDMSLLTQEGNIEFHFRIATYIREINPAAQIYQERHIYLQPRLRTTSYNRS